MPEMCNTSMRVANAQLQKRALLVCFLDAGHDGLHYDEGDDVSWKAGKPNA